MEMLDTLFLLMVVTDMLLHPMEAMVTLLLHPMEDTAPLCMVVMVANGMLPSLPMVDI